MKSRMASKLKVFILHPLSVEGHGQPEVCSEGSVETRTLRTVTHEDEMKERGSSIERVQVGAQ